MFCWLLSCCKEVQWPIPTVYLIWWSIVTLSFSPHLCLPPSLPRSIALSLLIPLSLSLPFICSSVPLVFQFSRFYDILLFFFFFLLFLLNSDQTRSRGFKDILWKSELILSTRPPCRTDPTCTVSVCLISFQSKANNSQTISQTIIMYASDAIVNWESEIFLSALLILFMPILNCSQIFSLTILMCAVIKFIRSSHCKLFYTRWPPH